MKQLRTERPFNQTLTVGVAQLPFKLFSGVRIGNDGLYAARLVVAVSIPPQITENPKNISFNVVLSDGLTYEGITETIADTAVTVGPYVYEITWGQTESLLTTPASSGAQIILGGSVANAPLFGTRGHLNIGSTPDLEGSFSAWMNVTAAVDRTSSINVQASMIVSGIPSGPQVDPRSLR